MNLTLVYGILCSHAGDYEECRLLGRGCVDLVGTDVLMERVASIFSVK
jgi:hypothetical protein